MEGQTAATAEMTRNLKGYPLRHGDETRKFLTLDLARSVREIMAAVSTLLFSCLPMPRRWLTWYTRLFIWRSIIASLDYTS